MSLPGLQDWRNVSNPSTRQVLDSYNAQMQTFLGVEHNDDGTHKLGAWTDEPYAATKFTANGTMTWTVASTNVTTYAYMKLGKTLWVSFYIGGTTVGGAVNSDLRIAIPGGFLPGAPSIQPFVYRDAGTNGIGVCDVELNNPYLILWKDLGAPNWTAGGNTAACGVVALEVL